MELDDIKYLLRDRLVGHSEKSASEIELLLRNKANNVLHKLRRSMYFELVSCILVVLAFAYLSIAFNWPAMQVYFGVFAFVFLVFLGIFGFMIRTTTQSMKSLKPLKEKLGEIIQIIQVFTRRYFQFTMLLLPVCFLFSLWLGYTEPKDVTIPAVESFNHLFAARWQLYVFLAIYIIGTGIGLYYFTRWYLQKLYGKYVQKLKEYLVELEDQS